MLSRLHIYFTGFIISFLGSLPFGSLNITAFNIAAYRSLYEALFYALAVVLVELIAVRITLGYSKKINFESGLILFSLPFFAAVLMYLSISGFIAAGNTETSGMNPIIYPPINSYFLLGLLLSLSNPLHFPFWMGWNAFLRDKGKLSNQPGMHASYIFGIGIGSMLALLVFIVAGKYLIAGNNHFHRLIDIVTSSLYLIFSCYLILLFIRKYYKVPYPSKKRV